MLVHRFINELEELEQNKFFCGRSIPNDNELLVIGTFNPDNESYPDESNNAEWFYGRTSKNKFWHYLPLSFNKPSLHPKEGHYDFPNSWRNFCIENKIIIIDLIKRIQTNETLKSQKDRELDSLIDDQLKNIEPFNISVFKGITFKKVIYSLAWSDEKNLPNLRLLRDKVNRQLFLQQSIDNMKQIKYCKAPWRNDSYESWFNAINK